MRGDSGRCKRHSRKKLVYYFRQSGNFYPVS